SFPKKFYMASLLTGLSTTTFLMIDVILAKHFFSPKEAGEYALLALVGKMVFFFGSLLNVFVVALISRAEGLKQNPHKTFYTLFGGAFLLTAAVYLFIGPFGYITMPILFGNKTFAILPYLSVYA